MRRYNIYFASGVEFKRDCHCCLFTDCYPISLLSLMLLHVTSSLLLIFPGAGSPMQGLSLRFSPLVYWGTLCSSIITCCAWPCILQIMEQTIGLYMEKGQGEHARLHPSVTLSSSPQHTHALEWAVGTLGDG